MQELSLPAKVLASPMALYARKGTTTVILLSCISDGKDLTQCPYYTMNYWSEVASLVDST